MAGTPNQKQQARNKISVYCAAARNNEPKIAYNQRRPFYFVDEIGTGWHVLDCSGFVINNFWNVMHDLHFYVADPGGQRYSGWGNTWTMEAWLRKHAEKLSTQPYLVGDIAMYDGHTTICHQKGTAATSDWTSHGTMAGPDDRKLNYRDDLRGVWRHPFLL